MNSVKPDWYTKARAGFMEKEGFSEEMKREVIHRIEQKQQHKKITRFKLSIALLASITVCSFMIVLYNSNLSLFPFLKSAPVQHTGGSSAERGTDQEWELDYQYSDISPAELGSLDGISSVETVPMERKNKSTVIMKEEVVFEGIGKFLSYVRSEDEQRNLHFGFELADDPGSAEGLFYGIGPGYLTDVKFSTSDAFGQSGFLLSGGCGPDLVCTICLAIEDGIPVINFTLHAVVYEADLDRDGIAEMIAVTSRLLNNKIYIYKKVGDRIEWVDVSAALKAESQDTISYNPDNQQFWIHSSDGNRGYRYASGEDKLVRVSD